MYVPNVVLDLIDRYIDSLVETLLESSRHQKEKLLPNPHLTIWFSSQPEMVKVA